MSSLVVRHQETTLPPPHPEPSGQRTYRVQVHPLPGTHQNNSLVAAAHQIGIHALEAISMGRIYFLQGALPVADVNRLAASLLADPVVERYTLSLVGERPEDEEGGGSTVEVTALPGVTDPEAETLLAAAHHLGIRGVARVATGTSYRLEGALAPADVERLALQLLSNPVIQQAAIDVPVPPPFVPRLPPNALVEQIPLRTATDETLERISHERRLALNLAEMRAIQAHYRREGREPNDVELETLAQTWSEHCVHKTFRAAIRYHGPLPGAAADDAPVEQQVAGLLDSYIRAATERLDRPWVRSAFVDNAGIIEFDDQWSLAFKVETHNHPSALEPFGGANTGIGGVVRDILGVSARPIANTDVLCFGPPDLPYDDLPAGVLHPRRVAEGVVHGIEDYGNKMGIPTVSGAILHHPGYTANPLVYCGSLGLLPRDSHRTGPVAGDRVVVLGGRTGRDGLRGATFSSMGMDQTTGDIAGSAVQIGHPIHEKQLVEVVVRARDAGLYHAITDCGAGGLSSAVGEMAEGLGARVQLQSVPLKYPGLRPWEIWLSEAQERMVMAVPDGHWPRLEEICLAHDVEAVTIGRFEATGRVRLDDGDRPVADLALSFLHDGRPRLTLDARWSPPVPQDGAGPVVAAADALLQLLAHPDIRSKESVIRRFDHEVQGGTALKPLVGVAGHGPGDGVVIVPGAADGSDPAPRGVALSVGICPGYGELDPYAMAWAAVDEAVRNLVATGADPERIALLDNFCWGDPRLPDRLGALVRCAQGCHDAALAYGAPFVSGKDSLNNEYLGADGERHAIPGTLLISALAMVPDVSRTVSMDLKEAGSRLYVLGESGDHLGGGHYQRAVQGMPAAGAPPAPLDDPMPRLRALHRAITEGLVLACHDCSEGGVAVALAEMAIAGRLGARVALDALPGALPPTATTARLFTESLGRFLIEVRPEDAARFETRMAALPIAAVGEVTATPQLILTGAGEPLLHLPVTELEAAFRGEMLPQSAPAVPAAAAPPVLPAHHRAPRALILHAGGTNRDREAALACDLAGARAEIVHINDLIAGRRTLQEYHMVVVPGGFSYGDDLGAGTRWALDLRHRLGPAFEQIVGEGRPVLGICNGFQVLVKAGLLPGMAGVGAPRAVTLAPNESGRFECRWVTLFPNPRSPSLWTRGLDGPLLCPVAHGEGRLAVAGETMLAAIRARGLDALHYGAPEGAAPYPANPNGSVGGIAALTNPAGNVMGLMPHPENHLFDWQHPRYQRGERGGNGLALFINGVREA